MSIDRVKALAQIAGNHDLVGIQQRMDTVTLRKLGFSALPELLASRPPLVLRVNRVIPEIFRYDVPAPDNLVELQKAGLTMYGDGEGIRPAPYEIAIVAPAYESAQGYFSSQPIGRTGPMQFVGSVEGPVLVRQISLGIVPWAGTDIYPLESQIHFSNGVYQYSKRVQCEGFDNERDGDERVGVLKARYGITDIDGEEVGMPYDWRTIYSNEVDFVALPTNSNPYPITR